MGQNIHFTFDVTITKGDDRVISFTFTDDNGDAVDISGWKFFYTAKADNATADASADLIYEDASFTISTNTASVTLLDTDTGDLTADSEYHHDLQILDAGSLVMTIGKGRLKVEEQTTQRIAAL